VNSSRLKDFGNPPALSLSQAILRNVDDEYIPDERVSLSPSDVVQLKLFTILPKGKSIPVSSVHNCREVRRYRNVT
jgi:hypothetical protein